MRLLTHEKCWHVVEVGVDNLRCKKTLKLCKLRRAFRNPASRKPSINIRQKNVRAGSNPNHIDETIIILDAEERRPEPDI